MIADIPDYVWTFFGTVVAAALGLWGIFAAHKAQKGTPENRLIDQQQEDIQALKADMAQMKTDHVTEMANLKLERAEETREFKRRMSAIEDRDRVYIPHILMLNRHIEMEIGPPAPAIPSVIDTYLRLAKEEIEATQ